jgi:hypothetical protein
VLFLFSQLEKLDPTPFSIRFRAGMRRSIIRKVLKLNYATSAEFRIDHDSPVCYKIDDSSVVMNRLPKDVVDK